jgi:transposase
MTAVQLIAKLINCKGIKISDFSLNEVDLTMDIWVQPYKNGGRCPTCDRRCKLITNADRKERTWTDIPMGEWAVIYHYSPREITCPTHGRQQENIPWAAAYSRVTFRFEHLMLTYASVMTLTAAAGLLRIPISTLSNILHKCIDRARDGHKIKNLTSIGIDEISYEKGHKYATIVYDLERSCVIWVGKGKGRKTIDDFFENVLGKDAALKITTASCDLGEAYIGAIEHYCKNATLVLDRFHVVKLLNEAVDEVRKEAWRELTGADKKAMKGLRWLLYRHSKTRTKAHTRILNDLKKSNNKIYRAWVLKDEFEQIWKYKYKKSAEDFLSAWITRTLKSRIDSMKTFANTMRRHFDKIVAFSQTGLTNAIAEGLNRILKIIKNRASGYQNLKVYSDMIYLTVGDVNISAQIPEDFRTSCASHLLTSMGGRSID